MGSGEGWGEGNSGGVGEENERKGDKIKGAEKGGG